MKVKRNEARLAYRWYTGPAPISPVRVEHGCTLPIHPQPAEKTRKNRELPAAGSLQLPGEDMRDELCADPGCPVGKLERLREEAIELLKRVNGGDELTISYNTEGDALLDEIKAFLEKVK